MFDYSFLETVKRKLFNAGYQESEENPAHGHATVLYKIEDIHCKIMILVDETKICGVTEDILFILKRATLDLLKYQIGTMQTHIQFVLITADKKFYKHIKKTAALIILPDSFRVQTCGCVADIFAADNKQIKNTVHYHRKKKQCTLDKTKKNHSLFLLIAIILLNSLLWLWRIHANFYSISGDTVLRSGGYNRLFTYMFFHTGFFHLLSNMIFLFAIGKIVIRKIGNILFLAAYLLCGVYAGLCSVGWHYLMGSMSETIGASGAICGILAIWIFVKQDFLEEATERRKRMGYAILILFCSSIFPGVDTVCHIAGFLTGLLLTGIYFLLKRTIFTVKQTKLLTLHHILERGML